jgi:hypothetical protein
MSDKTVMSRKNLAHRGTKIMCALLVVLGGVVAVSVETTHTAQAADCLAFQSESNWDIPFGCSGVRIPAAHHCMVVGKSADGKTQGVDCADLYVTNTKTTEDIWGEGEFSCSGAHPQCLGMKVEVWASENEDPPAVTVSGSYGCTTTGCPNGRAADVSTTHMPVDNGCFSAYSFEPADQQTVSTGPLKHYTNHEIISINGATSASHAPRENDSNRVNVCLDSSN